MTNTPASDDHDEIEDEYDYYDDDDWYDDEDEDYDPAYDFDDYGEEEYDWYGDADEHEWSSEPLTFPQRVLGEFAYRKYKFTKFVRAWTGTRLRNRFRRCPDCGRRNEPYWSDDDKVCSRCVIPF